MQGKENMKKLYSFLALFGAAALLSVSIGARETKTLYATGDKEVPISSFEAWKFAGAYDITSSYCDEGVKTTIPGADTVGDDAWWHRTAMPNHESMENGFSIDATGKVTFEFSVGFYDDSGNLLTKSRNGSAFDVTFYKAQRRWDEDVIGRLRIYTDSGSWNNGNHSMEIHTSGYTNKGNGSKWIKGDATLSSKFYVQVDKENYISSYVGGSDDVTRLIADDNLQEGLNLLNGVDKIWVYFGGDNGFTNSTDVIVRSIGGQSLANDGTNFTDNVAPIFMAADVPATLPYGEEYTLPVDAYDLLGAVTYEVSVNGGARVAGKTFTPNQAGETTVTLYATDAVGNESHKDFVFDVVQTIDPPTFVQLPTIQSRTVEPLEKLVFDMPEITDSTGTATVELEIYYGENKVATLEKNANNKFEMNVPASFPSGEYTFVYVATNTGGTTRSSEIKATFTLAQLDNADFVGVPENSYAVYKEKGIYCKTLGNWSAFELGVFDFAEGFDFKFVVDDQSVMDNAAVALHIISVANPDYVAEYRVWTSFSGGDRPTNVYISTNGWVNIQDITDTGWIKRGVDDVENQYHMAYNVEDTFVGERLGGMTRVDRAYDDLKTFFENAGGTMFRAYLSLGKDGVDYRSAYVTEINGQNFAAPITWQDAYLSVQSVIPEQIAQNEQLEIKAYAKDLRTNCGITLSGTDPDGAAINENFVSGVLNYTFTKIGNYHLVISATGANGNEVKIEKDVVCKSSTQEVVITVSGSYEATYALNSQVTILAATYSENVASHSIVVTEPGNHDVTVQAGDSYTFAKPGLYKITYHAQDDAQPEPNAAKVEFTINVPDTADPVIDIEGPESAKVNDLVTFTVTVTDDSDVDVTVQLTKPDGSRETLTGQDGAYSFTAAAKGEYEISVTAEDLYGNRSVETLTINVRNQSKASKGCGGSIAATSIILSSLAVSGLCLVFARKRKDK